MKISRSESVSRLPKRLETLWRYSFHSLWGLWTCLLLVGSIWISTSRTCDHGIPNRTWSTNLVNYTLNMPRCKWAKSPLGTLQWVVWNNLCILVGTKVYFTSGGGKFKFLAFLSFQKPNLIPRLDFLNFNSYHAYYL